MPSLFGIILKLVFFSIAMILLPISSYFLVDQRIFTSLFSSFPDLLFHFRTFFFLSDSIYSVITSVVVAHILLIGYIVAAYREEKEWSDQPPTKASNDMAPAFAEKQRPKAKKTE